jgi:hypothetical protein
MNSLSDTATALLEITDVEHISDYKLKIRFNDEHQEVVDFEHFLRASKHPDIRKYLDIDMFKTFTIDHGDLIWNDYELCFPISDLYSGEI